MFDLYVLWSLGSIHCTLRYCTEPYPTSFPGSHPGNEVALILAQTHFACTVTLFCTSGLAKHLLLISNGLGKYFDLQLRSIHVFNTKRNFFSDHSSLFAINSSLKANALWLDRHKLNDHYMYLIRYVYPAKSKGRYIMWYSDSNKVVNYS